VDLAFFKRFSDKVKSGKEFTDERGPSERFTVRVDARSSVVGRVCAVVSVVVVLGGCGPATLDVSSIEALEQSLFDLRERMTPEELARFDEALDYLVGGVTVSSREPDRDQVGSALDLHRPLAGRTAEGIVAEARFRRIREVRSAVIYLESGRDATEAARRDLAAFEFGAARVFKRHRQFLEWPVIEMRVFNGTGHTVYLVHFRAALLSPDDEDPWLLEEFDHVVFGAMEPGSSDVWRIEPRQRDWIRLIDPHPDLMFSIEPMRLEALGGNVLVSSDWGEIEAHRLAIYRHTLQTIRSSDSLALDSPPVAVVPPLALHSTSIVDDTGETAALIPENQENNLQ
jgi:hypothetical protein